MTELPVASPLIWTSSFLSAVATHAVPVLAWLWHEPDALAGASGQDLDVISFILADPGVSRRGKSIWRRWLCQLLQNAVEKQGS
jgi:hypothetical protein